MFLFKCLCILLNICIIYSINIWHIVLVLVYRIIVHKNSTEQKQNSGAGDDEESFNV